MIFNGMGWLLAGEHINTVKMEIKLAIKDYERDIDFPYKKRDIEKLKMALVLLSGGDISTND